MKKIYSVLASLLVATVCFGQSQRLVMFEEFTQASCPPCAATNPNLNAMLDANPTKVVSVKYQTDWPGYDPMNLQNPSQVQTRVTYYGVTGVPDGELDGGQGFSGQPYSMTQANIDSRYNTPSPFAIDVTHNLSANNDSIYCHATITCTQAIAGSMVAHFAVIERNIYFTNPPGTNGEKHFEGVMKKMLPTDQGTALAASFNVGDVLNLDYSWTLANVYDINQLAVVVWIQDNTNKHIHQAGYSRPHIPLDPLAQSLTLPSQIICTPNSIGSSVDVYNNGMVTLTSFDITYKIDNGTPGTYSWTGSLAPYATTSVTLPGLPVTAGSHTYNVSIVNPNGGVDLDPNNNNKTGVFGVPVAPSPANVTESFTSTTFPPSNWLRINPDQDTYQWLRVAQGNTTYSAKSDFYDSPLGNNDNLYVYPLDMTSANNPLFTFDIAHKRYSASYSDQLNVKVSIDCGMTWTTVYTKSGAALATVAGYITSAYVPVVTDWRNETVDLTPFVGQPDVLIEFNAVSGFGNNLFLDNINIQTVTGVKENSLEQHVRIYPIPSNGVVNLDVNFESAQNLKVAVYNLIGEEIIQFELAKTVGGIFPIDLSKVADGAYTVKISTDAETIVKSINILK